MTNANTHDNGQEESSAIRSDEPLNVLVVSHPYLRASLERLGIDYCCGGRNTLKEAAREAGLDLDVVIEDLRKTRQQHTDSMDEEDWNARSLTALVDHILEKHHAFMKAQLPRLHDLLKKVQAAHHAQHGEMLAKVRRAFDSLRSEIELHLMKEEEILFPAIKSIDAFIAGTGPRPVVHCGSVANPIRQMEYEHDNAGALLKEIRQITGNYHLPGDACASFGALYDGLAAMEADLHEHIHLENNILFPKSVAQETSIP